MGARLQGHAMLKNYLKKKERKAKQRKALLNKIGVYMVGSIHKNFRAQGRPRKWERLQDATIKARKGGGGGAKILRDTGDLQGSVTHKVRGNKVEVGTNLIYAATHQYGDPSRNIPAREFVVMQKLDKKNIEKMIKKYLQRKS